MTTSDSWFESLPFPPFEKTFFLWTRRGQILQVKKKFFFKIDKLFLSCHLETFYILCFRIQFRLYFVPKDAERGTDTFASSQSLNHQYRLYYLCLWGGWWWTTRKWYPVSIWFSFLSRSKRLKSVWTNANCRPSGIILFFILKIFSSSLIFLRFSFSFFHVS